MSGRINSFSEGQTKLKLNHFTTSLERKHCYQKNLLLRKDLLLKVCELIGKTPSLLGKVTVLIEDGDNDAFLVGMLVDW